MSGPDAVEVGRVVEICGKHGDLWCSCKVRQFLNDGASAAGLDPDADGSVVLTRRAGEWEVAGRLLYELDAERLGLTSPVDGAVWHQVLVPPEGG